MQGYGCSIGTQNFEKDFNFRRKKFKNSKVEALTGIKHNGWQVGSGVLYHLLPMFYLDITGSFYLPTSNQGVLYLKERSGFFLTRKTANEALNETEAVLNINGVPTQQSGVSNDNWSVSLGLRMMF